MANHQTFKMAASKNRKWKYLLNASDGVAIPTAIPTLSTMPDFSMSPRTLPDVVRLPKFKMAAIKPELEITLTGYRRRRDSKFYPHIFGHARLGYATVDTVRRCATLPDVDRLPKNKMAATETGNGNNY
jgi:hypothetical protein